MMKRNRNIIIIILIIIIPVLCYTLESLYCYSFDILSNKIDNIFRWSLRIMPPSWLTPVLADLRQFGLNIIIGDILFSLFGPSQNIMFVYFLLYIGIVYLIHYLLRKKLFKIKKLTPNKYRWFFIIVYPVLITLFFCVMNREDFCYYIVMPFSTYGLFKFCIILEDYLFLLLMPSLFRYFYKNLSNKLILLFSFTLWLFCHEIFWKKPQIIWILFAFIMYSLHYLVFKKSQSLIPVSIIHCYSNILFGWMDVKAYFSQLAFLADLVLILLAIGLTFLGERSVSLDDALEPPSKLGNKLEKEIV